MRSSILAWRTHGHEYMYERQKDMTLEGEPPGWKVSYMLLEKLLLLLSHFSHVRLYVTPQMTAHQAPPSLGFSRQEHRSGLPFPSPTGNVQIALDSPL